MLGCTAGSVTSTAHEAMQALRRGVAAVAFAGGVERVGVDLDLDLGSALRGAAESHAGAVPDLDSLAATARVAAARATFDAGWSGWPARPWSWRSRSPSTPARRAAWSHRWWRRLRSASGLSRTCARRSALDPLLRRSEPDRPRRRARGCPCGVMIPRGGSTLHLSGDGVGLLAAGGLRPLDRRSSTSWFPALSHDGAGRPGWSRRPPAGRGSPPGRRPRRRRPGHRGALAHRDGVGARHRRPGPGLLRRLRHRGGHGPRPPHPRDVPGHAGATHSRSSVRFVTADGFGTHPWTLRVDSRIGVEGATRSPSARSPRTAGSPSSTRSTVTGPPSRRTGHGPCTRLRTASWSRSRGRGGRTARASGAGERALAPGLGVRRRGAAPVRPRVPGRAGHRQQRAPRPRATDLAAALRRGRRQLRGRPRPRVGRRCRRPLLPEQALSAGRRTSCARRTPSGGRRGSRGRCRGRTRRRAACRRPG